MTSAAVVLTCEGSYTERVYVYELLRCTVCTLIDSKSDLCTILKAPQRKQRGVPSVFKAVAAPAIFLAAVQLFCF